MKSRFFKRFTALTLGAVMSFMAVAPNIVYATDGSDTGPDVIPFLSAEEINEIGRSSFEAAGIPYGGPGVTHPTVNTMGTWEDGYRNALPDETSEDTEETTDIMGGIINEPILYSGNVFDIPITQTSTLNVGERRNYNNHFTHYFDFGGTTSFCLEPTKGNPAATSYTATRLDNDEYDNWLRAIFYYGYNGPGYYDDAAGLDHFLEAANKAYAYDITHIIISYAYDYRNWHDGGEQGDFQTDAFEGITDADAIQAYKTIANYMWDGMGKVPEYYEGYLFNENTTTQTMGYGWSRPVGWLYLNKKSSNESITNGNSNYNLEGATYYIYDANNEDANWFRYCFKTDSNGKGWRAEYQPGQKAEWVSQDGNCPDYVTLEPGTYYVQEYDAAKGYQRDTTFYEVTITAGVSSYVGGDNGVTDVPLSDPLEIQIHKQDSDGNAGDLSGAEYTVYYFQDVNISDASTMNLASANKKWVIKTLYDSTLNAYIARLEDRYKVSGDEFYRNSLGGVTCPIGSYIITETKAPAGYTIDGNTFSCDGVTVTNNRMLVHITENNGDAVVDCGNTIIQKEVSVKGGVEITKRDTDTNGTTPQGDASLSGAVYAIASSATGGITVNGTHYDKDATIMTITTDASGHAGTNRKVLPAGNYYIYETTAPSGYKVNGTHYPFTIQNDDDYISLTTGITDPVIRGGVKINKRDAELSNPDVPQGNASLQGAVYSIKNVSTNTVVVDGVSYSNGQEVATITTNASGYAETSGTLLPYGNYTIQEKNASTGYKVNDTVIPFSITTDGQIVDLTNKDTTETVIRGGVEITKLDADTLTAVAQGDAKLSGATYAIVSDNTNPVYVEGVTYNNGATVKVLTTDANGHAASGQILPYGAYHLIETGAPEGYLLNATPIPFEITTDGQVFTTGQSAKDTVKKQAFQLIKISSNGSSSEVPVVAGAEFTVKLKSEVDSIGWDAARTFDVLTTDVNGYAKSIRLPYGTYLVRETVVPANMAQTQDFIVTVSEDSATAQAWRVFNDAPYEVYLKIVKKDVTSGETILLDNVTFKVKNDDTGAYLEQKVGRYKVSTFKTDTDGITVTPLKVKGGNYTIEEITAPDGYTLNVNGVSVNISNSVPTRVELDEDGEPVVVVEVYDEQVTGKVNIYKHGEVLEGVGNVSLDNQLSTLLNTSAPSEDLTFTYTDAPLEGCQFAIVADENIYTPDRQLDENGNRKIAVYNGVALTEGAIAATVLSDENGKAVVEGLPLGKYHVEEIAVIDGYLRNTKIDGFSLDYAGEDVDVVSYNSTFKNNRVKTRVELVKTGSVSEKPIEGAVYGLYNKNDITLADGTLVLAKDTLIEKQTTDKNGKLEFNADLPLDEYYVKEISSPAGCILNDEVYELSLKYVNDETPVISATVNAKDDEIVLNISKIDVTTNNELEGAKLTLFDSTGKVYDTWTSGKEPHVIVGIPAGTYTLHEDLTPLGYVTAGDITFEVKETAEVQKVTMVDKITTLELSKKDATTSEELEGARLTLFDSNGKVVETWTSGKEPHVITKIPTGTYTLHEDLAPLGYATAGDITFEVKDTAEVQKVTMVDKITTVEISKKDATTGEELEGAKLTLYDKDGKVVETWTSGKEPHVINKIAVGTYTLHEDLAPLGYATASDVTFEVKDTAEVQKVEMIDEIIKVQVSKVDIANDEELAGAHLQVICEDGSIYEEWDSTTEAHLIEKMPVGTYTLRETFAPEGFEIANDITFTVEDTGELQTVVMKDEHIPDTPKTGDENPITGVAAVCGIAVGVMGAVGITAKKRKRKIKNEE